MDETTKGAQGTPPPEGPSSGAEGGTTPAGKTYTEAEFQKALSDLKAQSGRKEKELAKSLKEIQAERDSFKGAHESTSARLEALEERLKEQELETVRSDPTQLRLYQEREHERARLRELEKRDRENAALRARYETVLEEIENAKKAPLLEKIANRVPAERLEKLKGLTPDALEAVVEAMGTPPAQPAPPAQDFTPDSGVSAPGLGEISPEWADTASMEEYAARRRKQEPDKFPL